jgi:transglutaminase-like putative cysteine protease
MTVGEALDPCGAEIGPGVERSLHPAAQRATYFLDQSFTYRYPTPIEALRHRLMVVPPPQHGDQRLLQYRVEVRGAAAVVLTTTDSFGNHQVDVRAARVAEKIEFEAKILVERHVLPGPFPLPVAALGNRRLLEPSRLTRPDGSLIEAARQLAAAGGSPLELVDHITTWVYEAMSYSYESTHVGTTAAEALALGRGVCQDYAHVMLALARLCGLAARYVSGHLVGEGGSHAWVEVLIRDPKDPLQALVVACDPTHGRRAGSRYLTIATGRDYTDVAPTSGTYEAACAGELSCRKVLQTAGPGGAEHSPGGEPSG